MSRDIKANPFLTFIRANIGSTLFIFFFNPDRNVNREQDSRTKEENFCLVGLKSLLATQGYRELSTLITHLKQRLD